ncbi:hypothetical protein NpPPO83_00000236 [Neofusicoccum parvum]|nr:hypothetical protein NpPPO83_00000236 [Neofusicoccum parvum]
MRVLDSIILSLVAVATALPTSGLPTGTNAVRDAYNGYSVVAKRPNPVDLGVVDGGRVNDPQPFVKRRDAKEDRMDKYNSGKNGV